jgi:hypothetical protein
MASTYLTRTPSLAGNRKTWTYSAWFKIGNVSTDAKRLFTSYDGSTAINQSTISLSDAMQVYNAPSGSSSINLTTNRLFRDCNAWYHIVVAVDTTQATGSNRVKLYINGVQETSFSIETYGSQNEDFFINSTNLHTIGRRQDNSQYFDGSMSHINFVDGTAYDASAFGEYDANGVWKIIVEPSVTYGTNGFFILKDGNSVTDQSGNSNNFTVGGTLTNTEDNPSNVFATFNALAYFGKGSALENGNTRAYGDSATSNNECSFTTLTGSSGKYYAEFKIASVGTASFIGISDIEYTILENNDGQYRPFTIMVQNNGTLNVRGSGYGAPTTTGSWSSSYTTNDILQVAMDLDNNYFYFGKNGTWQNSGVPSSGATGTGGVAITSDKNYAFTFGGYGSSPSAYANFGNGYFGTTAVSSAGTNASGIGIFEYDVPTGYTALSTKGLNL